MTTSIREHIKYCMYKYNIVMSDWYNSLSSINKKINIYFNRNININIKYSSFNLLLLALMITCLA